MVSLLVTALTTVLVAVSVVGVVLGGIRAGDGMSRYSGATWRAEERFHDSASDIDAIQTARTRGMCDAVAGTAEAALNAQTIGSPDVAKNPIGMGFTDGMSIAQQTISLTSGGDGGDAGAGSQDAGAASSGGSSSTATGGDGGPALAGARPETAPKTHYIAWYCKGFGFEPIWITTVEVYGTQESAASYPGGGLDASVPLVKVPLTGAFESADDARDAVYQMMSDPGYLSGIYAGMPVASIGGTVHSLEYCGGMAWFEERGTAP